MKLPFSEIRQFVYNRLKDSITYNSVVIPVTSQGNDQTTYPVIRLGKFSIIEDGTKDSNMTKVNASIDIVTKFSENLINVLPSETIAGSVIERLVDYLGITTNYYIIWAHFISANESETLIESGVEASINVIIEYYVEQK